jgi:hypothetical protein
LIRYAIPANGTAFAETINPVIPPYIQPLTRTGSCRDSGETDTHRVNPSAMPVRGHVPDIVRNYLVLSVATLYMTLDNGSENGMKWQQKH